MCSSYNCHSWPSYVNVDIYFTSAKCKPVIKKWKYWEHKTLKTGALSKILPLASTPLFQFESIYLSNGFNLSTCKCFYLCGRFLPNIVLRKYAVFKYGAENSFLRVCLWTYASYIFSLFDTYIAKYGIILSITNWKVRNSKTLFTDTAQIMPPLY